MIRRQKRNQSAFSHSAFITLHFEFGMPAWLSSDSSPAGRDKLPGALPHESASLSVGPISASVVKLQSHSASNGESAGESPAGCTNFRFLLVVVLVLVLELPLSITRTRTRTRRT